MSTICIAPSHSRSWYPDSVCSGNPACLGLTHWFLTDHHSAICPTQTSTTRYPQCLNEKPEMIAGGARKLKKLQNRSWFPGNAGTFWSRRVINLCWSQTDRSDMVGVTWREGTDSQSFSTDHSALQQFQINMYRYMKQHGMTPGSIYEAAVFWKTERKQWMTKTAFTVFNLEEYRRIPSEFIHKYLGQNKWMEKPGNVDVWPNGL